jgi:hypothetical protein
LHNHITRLDFNKNVEFNNSSGALRSALFIEYLGAANGYYLFKQLLEQSALEEDRNRTQGKANPSTHSAQDA